MKGPCSAKTPCLHSKLLQSSAPVDAALLAILARACLGHSQASKAPPCSRFSPH